MKNMKKIIAVLMSLTAIAMSTSAFAEVDVNGTATYNGDADNASVKYETTTLDGVADKQLTVVIVPTNLGEEGITSGNIYYINQATAGEDFNKIIADMKVKDGFAFAENKYEVRIGGVLADDYYSCVVTGKKLDVIFGDADGDGAPTPADASLILQKCAGWTVIIDLVAADANADGTPAPDDASLVLQKCAGWNVTLGPVVNN